MVKIQSSPYLSNLQSQEITNSRRQETKAAGLTKEGLSFQDVLKQRTLEETANSSTLRFSRHAANRLADRNISLTDEQMERLSDGTQKAGAKGIRESLVIVDQLAFIVNIPNQTVVTAMDQKETQENIFTNIDGAVIM